MKTIIVTAAAALLSLSLVNPVSAAPSACKGLEQAVCGSTAQCTWRGALVKGETQTKAGAPSKVSRKAHCAKQRSKAEKA